MQESDRIGGARAPPGGAEFHKLVEMALPAEDILLYDARAIVKGSDLRSAAEADFRRSFHNKLDDRLDALPANKSMSIDELAE
jgi:hypothetical protein